MTFLILRDRYSRGVETVDGRVVADAQSHVATHYGHSVTTFSNSISLQSGRDESISSFIWETN